LYRGISRLALEKYEGAIDDLTLTIEINPHLAKPFFYRGYAYQALNYSEKACKDMKKAKQLGHPDASEAIEKFCE
jgi:tetratricopeptide (TPR) repeat protein